MTRRSGSPICNPYLVYRREIAAVHEWPFDAGIATRLAFYLIIPPATWLGAALIGVAVRRFDVNTPPR
jgi:hypothetical protein